MVIPPLHDTDQYTEKIKRQENMKKSTKKPSLQSKLALRSETVASLTLPQLGQVVGGWPDGSVLKGCVVGTL